MFSSNLADDGQVLASLLDEASRICAQISSFGEVLNTVRQVRNLSQKQFAKCVGWSEAEVSRLMNNQLPKSLGVKEVDRMATNIGCSPIEIVRLVQAYICHVLYREDFINPDVF